MLDLVTHTPKALENCRVRGSDVFSTHHDIGDTSLYENFAKFRPCLLYTSDAADE